MNYAKEWLEIDRATMIILILPFLELLRVFALAII